MTPFCKNSEMITLSAMGLSQWPDGAIPWAITDLVPSMNEAELRRACEWGFRQWAIVCNVKPQEVEVAGKARVLITCRKIDGPGGVLAECELPQPGMRYVRLWLDVGEQWSSELPSIRAIYLANVLWHEFGHALGMGHAPDRSRNVMAPVYDPSVTVAGQWDIGQSQQRYGRPVTVPPPVPSTPTPATPAPGGNGMGNFFVKLLMNFAKQWLEKAIADGSLQKWLEELLKKLAGGGIATVEQLGDAMTETATTAKLIS